MSIECNYCTAGVHDTAVEVRECAADYYRTAPPSDDAKIPHQSPSRVAHEEERNELFEDLRMARDAVPEGEYVLINDDGDWEAFRVEKPNHGKWRGFTFIKKLDEHGNARRFKGMKMELEVLTRIGADPEGAAERFTNFESETPCR